MSTGQVSSAGSLCDIDLELSTSLKEIEVWFYQDSSNNKNNSQQQLPQHNATVVGSPPLSGTFDSYSSGCENSVVSRGIASETSSILRLYTNDTDDIDDPIHLEDLVDRFRQTQDALLCGSSSSSSSNNNNNNGQDSPPHNRWRIVKKGELLRLAMIMTMLSSQDSKMAQAAQDALRDNTPIIVNPYQVLQVRRDATPQEIRQAYRRLALWHHPGRCCGGTTTPDERNRRLHVFEILAASYETLLDKECRSRCDTLLSEKTAEQARSKDLPAGMVNVGGRPLSPGSTLSNKLDGASDTFVARVISRLAGSRIGSSFDTQDDTVSTAVMPMVEPASSDSSEEGDVETNMNEHDASSLIEGRVMASPRIHVPLGTPIAGTSLIGTPPPLQQTPTETDGILDGCMTPKRPRKKKGSLMDSLNCGVNNSASFDQLPPLVNSSSSTGEPKDHSKSNGEIHYTECETNRLFGGPLQLMYRARRWKSFRDPMEVFADVFGSKVALGTNAVAGTEYSLSLPPNGALLLPPPNSSAAWSGSSETLKDGTVLFRTSRILHNRRMTRTEAVWTDPETGQRHSKVTVESEVLDDDEEGVDTPNEIEEDPEGCFSFAAFCSEVMLCDESMCEGSKPVETNTTATSVTAVAEPSDNLLCGAGCGWF